MATLLLGENIFLGFFLRYKLVLVLGGGFKHLYLCSPLLKGKISILTCAYFSDGLVQPSARVFVGHGSFDHPWRFTT